MRLLPVCVALLCVVYGCGSKAEIPTATLHAQHGSIFDTGLVIASMRERCSKGADNVRLDLRQGDVRLGTVFVCADLRNDGAAKGKLTDLVAGRHNAMRRAEQVAKFQRLLGVSVYSHTELVWGFGNGIKNWSCTRASDADFHRRELESAGGFTTGRESAVRWTEIEAALIAGACPRQLPRFFSSLAERHHPTAARIVRAELQKLTPAS